MEILLTGLRKIEDKIDEYECIIWKLKLKKFEIDADCLKKVLFDFEFFKAAKIEKKGGDFSQTREL